MKGTDDSFLRRDIAKIVCLLAILLGVLGIFTLAPSFTSPAILALVVAMLFSPWITALERKGFSRIKAIAILYLITAVVLGAAGAWAIQTLFHEWDRLQVRAPAYVRESLERLSLLEYSLKNRFPFLERYSATQTLLDLGHKTSLWFAKEGPILMSQTLTWILVTPPLSFIFLSEGPKIRRRFFQMIPNRFFESFFLMTNDILKGISDYIRAKLFEAFLVGALTALGLTLVGAPYAIVFGAIAGVTNIIPYAGPVLGAIAPLVVTGFDAPDTSIVYGVALVLVLVNAIDMTILFPVVVGKLVRLHPVFLVVAVAIGQRYYGLVGMLLSIPIATALKVIFQEIYYAVYEHRT